jgi:hypothetical protein
VVQLGHFKWPRGPGSMMQILASNLVPRSQTGTLLKDPVILYKPNQAHGHSQHWIIRLCPTPVAWSYHTRWHRRWSVVVGKAWVPVLRVRVETTCMGGVCGNRIMDEWNMGWELFTINPRIFVDPFTFTIFTNAMSNPKGVEIETLNA